MHSWIAAVAHNNLDLTEAAIESFLAQDIGSVRVLVVNNESTDNTAPWLVYAHRQWSVESIHIYPQQGVAHAWNRALEYLFGPRVEADRVLVCNNDVRLRSDAYTMLDRESAPFVTGVGTDDEGELGVPIRLRLSDRFSSNSEFVVDCERRPHPDFSCFLIRRDCYSLVGPFDENYRIAFAEDADYHVRMSLQHICAYCIDLPFYHVGGGSQTIKRATDIEAQLISEQAERNRQYFERKWGFEVASPEYYEFFATDPGVAPV